MREGSIKVAHVMQGRRAEDQVEPRGIAERHQIAHDIAHIRMRSMPGNVDQWRTDVDADDLVKVSGEHLLVPARSTAGIKCPASMARQLRDEPLQDTPRLQSGEAIIVGSEAIEGLTIWHVPTLAVAAPRRQPG